MARKCISVKPGLFQAMQNVDIKELSSFKDQDLRSVLPCLVRAALCAPVDSSGKWTRYRKDILKILAGVEVVNSIVALLSIDFHALEQDVKKEQQLRSKIGGSHTDSVLVSQLQTGLTLEFEHSDPARRIRLLLCELLFILSQIKENKTDFSGKQWELFECEVYLEEVSDVLCIAQAELPNLLQVQEVAEALMYAPNGPWLLCRLVANSPDCFKEVCSSLVSRGEKQDEESVSGRKRMEILQALCAMNPKEALFVRSLCVEHCTMPGLCVALTLSMTKPDQSETGTSSESANDLVPFVSGLLLGNNPDVRNWFSMFVKSGQRRGRDPSSSMLHSLRQQLLTQVQEILQQETREGIPDSAVIQASSFIRLYCALKGMAALKFSDEEMKLLLRLVTAHPPPTKSGARFVSLGLCMLIACPYLLGNQEQERQVSEWIRWLMASEGLFEREAGRSSSFGEMLFLVAIHFHGNHMHAIAELVCSTLGMKSAVKANALARIRQIFTQEIFTEEVITAHAITVPVTEDLNAGMSGYLAIHCVYQLLKSRAFSKYKVPIKDWIYQQICHSYFPLHPLLPSLIEVYVNSIMVKSAKTDHTNQPITVQEISDLFTDSVFKKPDIMGKTSKPVNLAPQMCILYYILLYEETLESQRKNLVLAGRNVEPYPETLMAKIPINYLVQEAQKNQDLYGGLFSSLLRLLVAQFPHLCIIEDWLEETLMGKIIVCTRDMAEKTCTVAQFKEAVSNLHKNPTLMLIALESILTLPKEELLAFSEDIVSSLPQILAVNVPRKIIDLVKKVWFKLHSLTPRSLRLATVNALRPVRKSHEFKFSQYTETDITVDPLIVLRCDERVYRCAPVLEIILRVLAAYTQACRVYMENHIQSNPVLDGNNQVEQDRQELKNCLLAAQESAMIQILLEYCQAKPDERKEGSGLLSNLREIQCVICSYIHQIFISDPNLAKLVHFQGYPSELLPVTVAGIPSMHICLDYIPELLSQPQMDKQIFGIKLMSHLSCQFALPKSLSVAKLCINVMFAMVGVLEAKKRVEFFSETLPCLAKVCQAFPPLCEDVTTLLAQIGRVCLSHISSFSNRPETDIKQDSIRSNRSKIPSGPTDIRGGAASLGPEAEPSPPELDSAYGLPSTESSSSGGCGDDDDDDGTTTVSGSSTTTRSTRLIQSTRSSSTDLSRITENAGSSCLDETKLPSVFSNKSLQVLSDALGPGDARRLLVHLNMEEAHINAELQNPPRDCALAYANLFVKWQKKEIHRGEAYMRLEMEKSLARIKRNDIRMKFMKYASEDVEFIPDDFKGMMG